MRTTLYSGLCGSGKTTTAINAVVSSNESKFLFVIPSKDAAQQISVKIKELDPSINVHLINEDTVAKSTSVFQSAVFTLFTNSQTATKDVVVISHATYIRLTESNVKDWNVFHDELQELFAISHITFDSRGYNTFDNLFVLGEDRSVTLSEYTLHTSNHSGKSAPIKELIEKIKSGRFSATAVSVPSESTRNDTKHKAKIILMPSDQYFIGKTLTLMAADIEMDPLSVSMGGTVTHLQSFNNNHDSNKIQIKYVFDENDNTRTFRTNNPEALEAANRIIESDIDGDNALLCSNDNNNHGLVAPNFYPLSHNAHGRNDLSDYSNLVFLTSMNMDRATLSVLNDHCGIDESVVYWRLSLYTAYQCIMRGNLRKAEDTTGFTIYVYDLKMASSLKDLYFNNATITKIGNIKVMKKERKKRTEKEVKTNLPDGDRSKFRYIIKNLEADYYNPEDVSIIQMAIEQPRHISKSMLEEANIWTKLSARGKYL